MIQADVRARSFFSLLLVSQEIRQRIIGNHVQYLRLDNVIVFPAPSTLSLLATLQHILTRITVVHPIPTIHTPNTQLDASSMMFFRMNR